MLSKIKSEYTDFDVIKQLEKMFCVFLNIL